MKKEKRKEGRANGASLACGLNAATFPPKRNLKVGKPLLLVVTATLIAVNETSCATLALSIFHRVTVRNRVSQVIPLPSNTLPTFPPFHSRPVTSPEDPRSLSLRRFSAISIQIFQRTAFKYIYIFFISAMCVINAHFVEFAPLAIPLLPLSALLIQCTRQHQH